MLFPYHYIIIIFQTCFPLQVSFIDLVRLKGLHIPDLKVSNLESRGLDLVLDDRPLKTIASN